ncbi:hypothetical protein SAMN04515647_3821 [Cohaesibacter sp. ES.047]|uniref:hypothetical protein n=1 Tax=Cohaesibacter sp. ES.047 TaxID=1798205 RepID=UPI000BB7EBD0|nr:hypothetical protein [Cohaesibacter sp. ES.047]SNY93522.1 hypothetical protein SAMN04515647_3821 [Cohaesibacter sp. ES.047]
MDTATKNLFRETLTRARGKGQAPDKWVINGHVAKALVLSSRNHDTNFIDVVDIKDQTLELLGLPVVKSWKIDPMIVLLAEGKKGIACFPVPLVLDLTELGPIA